MKAAAPRYRIIGEKLLAFRRSWPTQTANPDGLDDHSKRLVAAGEGKLCETCLVYLTQVAAVMRLFP